MNDFTELNELNRQDEERENIDRVADQKTDAMNMVKDLAKKKTAHRLRFHYKNGALTCEQFIPGVTQTIKTNEAVSFYRARYFICETIMYPAAVKFAEFLGGEIVPDE